MIKYKTHLIPLKLNHLSTLVKWRNKDRIKDTMFNDNKITLFTTIMWHISNIRNANSQYFIIQDVDDKNLIGLIGLTNINFHNRTGELDIYIGEDDYLYKGLASDAFLQLADYAKINLNLNRIKAYLLTDNTIAFRFYNKLGFRVEGTLKKEILKNSELKDIQIMAYQL